MDNEVNNLKQDGGWAWCLVAVYLVVGWLFSFVYRSGMKRSNAQATRSVLFQPPPLTFAIVWPVLYVLAGYSVCRVVQRAQHQGVAWAEPGAWAYWVALLAAALHLALSNAWIALYAHQKYRSAIFVLLALFLAVAAQLYGSAAVDRVAGLALVPLQVWLLFALMMNAALVQTTNN